MVGVASIIPIVVIAIDKSNISNNYYLYQLYSKLNKYLFINEYEFIILLAVSSIFVVAISIFYKAYTQYCLNEYIETSRSNISIDLINNYLNKSYDFYMSTNGASLSKKIIRS